MDLLKDVNGVVTENDQMLNDIEELAESVFGDAELTTINENSLGVFLDRVESQMPKIKVSPNTMTKVAYTLAALYMQQPGKESAKLSKILDKASELGVDGMANAVDQLQIPRDSADKVQAKLMSDMQGEGKATKHIMNMVRKKFIKSNL